MSRAKRKLWFLICSWKLVGYSHVSMVFCVNLCFCVLWLSFFLSFFLKLASNSRFVVASSFLSREFVQIGIVRKKKHDINITIMIFLWLIIFFHYFYAMQSFTLENILSSFHFASKCKFIKFIHSSFFLFSNFQSVQFINLFLSKTNILNSYVHRWHSATVDNFFFVFEWFTIDFLFFTHFSVLRLELYCIN